MQSWAIKIDIKLNIDDLNWSVDGQIIEDIKSENVFSHVRRSWQEWQDWAETLQDWVSQYFTYN